MTGKLSDTDETITFKRSQFYLALLPASFVLGLVLGYVFGIFNPFAISAPGQNTEVAARQEAAGEQNPTAAPEQAAQEEIRRYEVPEDDNPSIGPEDAEITIIEFSDYECPYCRKWHIEVFDKIREDYPEQVRLVYRDFPLKSIHPNALPAAAAANCAIEQDAFWDFNRKLFSGEYDLSDESYKRISEELELDQAAFEQCLSEGRYVSEVESDYEYASNLGVRSTPTFFVNGIPIVGAQPYEVFQDLIDKELAGEIPK